MSLWQAPMDFATGMPRNGRSNGHRVMQLAMVAGLFAVAFVLIPVAQLARLSLMPGDLGDARLNNYFLENIYQFLKGSSPSLINLGFFYPFPCVLGFSDNLFGSSPIYLLARVATGQSDTAFQIWFLAGYCVNYWAAYYALRKLEAGVTASAIGAMIFAFALPVGAQAGHAQLHYRFGVPLSLAMYLLFLDKKEWRYLVASAGWLVWQLYCTIYIGFFLLLMLAAISCIHGGRLLWLGQARPSLQEFIAQWRVMSSATRRTLLCVTVLLAIALSLLFYPYRKASALYKAKRHWDEISSMLPRPQSYLLMDSSRLWASRSDVFAGIPMRHEHQMFVGAIPMVLALIGCCLGRKRNNGLAFALLSASLIALMGLTLSWGGYSMWWFLHKLPLASAIRAMTRIVLVLLFPVAYLSAIAVDRLRGQSYWGRTVVFVGIIPLLIFESANSEFCGSSKAEWRNRVREKEAMIPAQLPPDPVLFFAQSREPGASWIYEEVDAMWVSLMRGVPTLNGYSGWSPPGFSGEYGDDWAELSSRIRSYVQFSGRQADPGAYWKLSQRVVPIGFSGYNSAWLISPPPLTGSSRACAVAGRNCDGGQRR